MSFYFVRQHDIKDCAAACLSMICRSYKLKLPMAKFRELIKIDSNGANVYGIVDASRSLGLDAVALEGNFDEYIKSISQNEISFPHIARIIVDETLEHFVVVYKMTNKYIYIADPGDRKKKLTYSEFFNLWTGHIITFTVTKEFHQRDECRGTIRRFTKLIKNQKKLIFESIFFSIFISAFNVTSALVFKIIIDGIQGSDSVRWINGLDIVHICLAVICLYIVQAIFEVARGFCLADLSKKVEIPLILGYYNHVMDLPINFLENRKTGELLSRVSDASNIKEILSSAMLSLILDTITVLGCVIILIALSPILFFICLFTTISYAIVVALFIKPIKFVNEKTMENSAYVLSCFKESIDGVETIKSYGAEEYSKHKSKKKFEKYIHYATRGLKLYAIQDAISGFIAATGVVVLICSGSILVMNNVVSLGTLITFYALLGYFINPVQNLIDLQPELQTAIVAAERLNDILDASIEENKTHEYERENYFSFENVNFRYGNRQLVLKNINMTVSPGERVALVGESGSGKTTLAKLLMGFYSPEQGYIRIGNIDLSEMSPKEIRKDIAYISQDCFLFSDTIENNLRCGNDTISKEEIEHACQLSMADKFIQKLPLGYDTLIGENGNNLSGGQKQRLAIARALLKHPKILIMDEATSQLDALTEATIKDVIDRLDHKLTCLIIAHRLSTIKNCNKIFVLEDGMIVESGTHESLLERRGRYFDFYKQNT